MLIRFRESDDTVGAPTFAACGSDFTQNDEDVGPFVASVGLLSPPHGPLPTFMAHVTSNAMPEYLKQASAKAGKSTSPTVDVPKIVREVITDIRSRGDEAVRAYSERFDQWAPASFKLSNHEIQRIISKVPQVTLDDIKTVQESVRTFALAQRKSLTEFEMEIQPGVHLGQKHIPIGSVGA